MPVRIRALSLESIMPRNRGGGQSTGRLELMRLEHPATTLKRSGRKATGPHDKGRPSGPKPVKIRAEQEDMK